MSPLMSDVTCVAIFLKTTRNDHGIGAAMTTREVLAALISTLAVLGPVMAVHWIATMLQ